MMGIGIYLGISLLVFGVDIALAVRGLKKNTELGRRFSITCFCSASVDVFYVLGAFATDRTLFSLFSTLYFIAIDLTLYWFVRFIFLFTAEKRTPAVARLHRTMEGLMAVDIASLLINIFTEHAIGYHPQSTPLQFFKYDIHPMYVFHLVLSYALIAVVLAALIRKLVKVSSGYRMQYVYGVFGIVLVVLVNAMFLYLPGVRAMNYIDWSIWLYSMTAFFLYWNCFVYPARGLLTRFRNRIFESIDQGLVLFDYNDTPILHNARADALLDGIDWKDPECRRVLMQRCGFPEGDANAAEYTVQSYMDDGVEEMPIRCDVRMLKGDKGDTLGTLFVLSDTAYRYDLLTGFERLESYLQRIAGKKYERPTAVAVCDLNGLGDLNRDHGRRAGDEALVLASQMLRKVLPNGGTELIRGRDAHMIVVCRGMTEDELREVLTSATRAFSVPVSNAGMQFAVSGLTEQQPYVREAVRIAEKAMMVKKLMDRGSTHSDLLSSLVKALEETDDDTELHVRRTRAMGAAIGRRIGLTDVQQSDLSLLCLLHDIGKIGIPLEILNKPGKLTDAEWQVMKTHVDKGYQIAMSTPMLSSIAEMIRYHHERWDGKGYPECLKGEEIPLLSRVISVVDSYDAMVNDRVYRKAVSRENACAELRRCAGTQFDPAIAELFASMVEADEIKIGRKKQDMPEEIAETVPESCEESGGTGSFVHVMNFARYVLDNTDNMRIVSVDQNFTELTGYTQAEVIENSMTQSDMIFPEDREEYEMMTRGVLSHENYAYFEHRVRCKDGTPKYVFCFGRVFYDSAVRAMHSEIIVTDIAMTYSMQLIGADARQLAQQQLLRYGTEYPVDTLTGLMDPEPFRSAVELAMKKPDSGVMLLVADVDHFREYNEVHGRRAGDTCLTRVAQVLTSNLRRSDLACRISGDAFAAALVFPHDTPRDAMLERARLLIGGVNLKLTDEFGMTISAGTAFSGPAYPSYGAFFAAAETALVTLQSAGRIGLMTADDE